MCRYTSGWQSGIAISSSIFSTQASTPPRSDNLAAGGAWSLEIALEVEVLTRLFVEFSVVREERSFRLAVLLGVEVESTTTSGLATISIEAETAVLGVLDCPTDAGSSGTGWEDEGSVGEFKFIRVFLCVDQSPCIDRLSTLELCLGNCKRIFHKMLFKNLQNPPFRTTQFWTEIPARAQKFLKGLLVMANNTTRRLCSTEPTWFATNAIYI